MRFKALSPTSNGNFIRSVRKATLVSLGVSYNERYCEPIPHGSYLAIENGNGIVGVAEAFWLKDAHPLIAQCPFANLLNDELMENYTKICHLRTIYVYPEFRKSFYYLYLALGMTLQFASRGATFATAVTAAADNNLNKLYCRTGGKYLGTFRYNGINEEFSAYAFRDSDLLAHPFSQRIQTFFQPSSGQGFHNGVNDSRN